jgi:trigger factor
MDIAVTDLGRCVKRIAVVVPAETVNKELDAALAHYAQQIVLPGFRPGKTPKSIVEKRFGEDICHAVAGELAQTALKKAMEEHRLEPVSEAKLLTQHLHAHRGETMKVEFEIETKADFEVSGYRGLEVERELAPVADKEVDDVVETLRKRESELEPVGDDGYRTGDWIVAAVKAEVEGKVVYDKSEESIAGEHGARLLDFDVPDLAEKLAGRKPGDVVAVDAVVSDFFEDKALHGKPARTTIVVGSVKRAKLPEIDDDLAKKAGAASVLELRLDIRKKLEARHVEEADRKVDEALIDQLVAKIPFEMADGPIERAVVSRVERAAVQLRMYGKSASEAAEAVEKKREELRKSVERDARAWLIFEKIAKKEKIFALEEDVAREYERLARENGHTPGEVRRYYEEKDLTGELRAEILEKKVRDYLRSQSKIVDRGGAAAAAGG